MAVSIYCYLKKHKTKEKHFLQLHNTKNKSNFFNE